jgi:hypothetical protein
MITTVYLVIFYSEGDDDVVVFLRKPTEDDLRKYTADKYENDEYIEWDVLPLKVERLKNVRRRKKVPNNNTKDEHR